jgi:lysophospholipase L1-like esterase
MNWETILFLGDSLTLGARNYLGYPEYCGDILTKKLSKEWNIINHATNGYTAIDLTRSISNNYASLATQNPLLSIILIGTNDAKIGTSKNEFGIALEQIIVKSKLLSLNNNVLLLCIPQLETGVSYPYNVDMNQVINGYNQVIISLAKKHKIKALSISLEKKHFFDGVHFNKEGTIYFAEGIANHILKQKGY